MTTDADAAPPRRIQYVPLAEVQTAERNPRQHASLEKVKASIREYGFVEGAVHDGRTGKIIAGHGRLEALQAMLKAGEDPPEGIVVSGNGSWLMPLQYGWASSNDEAAEALLVGLNRLSELGGWERDELATLLDDLRASSPADFDLTGFNSLEVDEMLAEIAAAAFEELDDPGDLDDAPEPPEPEDAVSRPGDVWILGRHRLVVGDATSLETVQTALAGERAQMVFTDPPYGVSYVGQRGMTLTNDDLGTDDLLKMLTAAFTSMGKVLIPGGVFYVCAPGLQEPTFRRALEQAGLTMRQQLIWAKDSLVLGHSDYHWQHETLLYGWAAGPHLFEGGRAQTTVWLYPKPRRSDLHPTQKPVELVRRAIVNSSLPGVESGRILDLFGGSGSTMVACETSHRVCSMVELDRVYADVIVQRMRQLFDIDGARESDGAVWSDLRPA